MAKMYGDRWRNIRNLSAGSQGEIYEVKDTREEYEGSYALKRLRHRERLPRFELEVKTLQELKHPGILKVVDADTSGVKPYFVTELHPGDLEAEPVSTWTNEKRLDVFVGVLDAVGAAHAAKIVHRDLKPKNILMSAAGNPVVADFGICYVEDGQARTLLGEVVGARGYTAPELLEGVGRDVTPAADVYSLGKLLAWLFTGQHLWRERFEEQHELDERGSSARNRMLNDLLRRMLEEDPNDRIHNVLWLVGWAKGARRVYSGDTNYPHPTLRQKCIYCEGGTYRLLNPDSHGIATKSIYLVRLHGLRQDQKGLRYMECDACGNVQVFRPKAIKHEGRNPWK